MDYRNGRVTSASVCKGPASAKSQAGGKCECNIGMTYEQLAATWKPIRRRERWTRK